MDIFSHGLWTNFVFRAVKQTKNTALIATFFGIAPDLFSFGLDFVLSFTGLGNVLGIPSVSGNWQHGNVVIPDYIYRAYDITHSLIIFGAVFLIVWLWRKRKFFWPLAGWGLHILIDIPSHNTRFFPTPFLWPLSDYKLSGISWGTPAFFITNAVLLLLAYLWLLRHERQAKN